MGQCYSVNVNYPPLRSIDLEAGLEKISYIQKGNIS